MHVIYIAGPFRGKHQWAQFQNIRRAEEMALEVWMMGCACICPHANTMHFQGAAPDELWLRGDLEILKRCDAVLMTPDWTTSVGATAEREFARSTGIPVFHSIPELREWLTWAAKIGVTSETKG